MRFAGKLFVTWLVTWFCTGLAPGNFAVHVLELLQKSFENFPGKFPVQVRELFLKVLRLSEENFLVHVPKISRELFRELLAFASVAYLALRRVCQTVFI